VVDRPALLDRAVLEDNPAQRKTLGEQNSKEVPLWAIKIANKCFPGNQGKPEVSRANHKTLGSTSLNEVASKNLRPENKALEGVVVNRVWKAFESSSSPVTYHEEEAAGGWAWLLALDPNSNKHQAASSGSNKDHKKVVCYKKEGTSRKKHKKS
jgi:hypothetical protein